MAAPTHDFDGLGAVVLAYGSGRSHELVLASLDAEGVAPNAVVLVHNPAAPGEAPPPSPSGVEVIGTGRNRGYAGGMNVGIEALRHRGVRLLLLLTHDAVLRPGAVEALTGVLRRAPRIGIVAPALFLAGGDTPHSFGGTTSSTGLNAHRRVEPSISADGVAYSDWVDGGTMLVRDQVFAAVGGLDERFWAYCEEADLCLRARRRGWGVGVVPTARADQAPGAAKRPGVWAYLMTRNGIEYARRARGARGLGMAVLRAVAEIGVSGARTLLRTGGLRPGDPAEPRALAIGAARGLIDFFRGRWGGPPAGLPGAGDVDNV